MKLAYWMYAGPAHIGTLRIASSFRNVHAIMHAPLGDDHFNVMRSMLERERDFTPITTSVVDRHVLARGSREKVVNNISQKEDLQNFVDRASSYSESDVILADVNHYRINELQAADKTLEQIVQYYLDKARKEGFLNRSLTDAPSANIIGISTPGFQNQHDCRELKCLLSEPGISINQIIPEGEFLKNLKDLSKKVNYDLYVENQIKFVSQATWFSKSIDCQNLAGKEATVSGDATHAAAITKILVREMGIHVSCSGTYCKHDADWFNEHVQGLCDETIITEDHTEIGDTIAQIEPSAIFGTQMERHIGKRLDIPCGVISSPVHIQNFPLGYRPFLGYEGTNQISDLIYNSFNLGMEDHLLDVFGGHDTKEVNIKSVSIEKNNIHWSYDAESELKKIPGFVKGKIKKNTEVFAKQNNISTIRVDVMYAVKEKLSS
ncbi:hypothetical protein KP509_11G075200 [Ceratopteris richardii]|uniref:Light-independent protochlorophyllide reductase subunit B n=1 Tax=Ceratopteris richardii TaxID=49495 RepID=A0A8T2TSW0_CERRI|nr:hypothetical protein KP509_11G075200 [Ceratopteris richardii]